MRANRLLFRLSILVSAFAFAVPAQSQDPVRMNEIVEARIVGSGFMGAVLVARGDDVLLNEGYGFANLEWGIANTTDTKFRIGSITKQFTAASVLILEERGVLDVDDTVSAYIEDAPESWSGITIFHLLTHSAGLPNYTSLPGYGATMSQPSQASETVAGFRDLDLEFEPGAEMRYSNSGYVLLGHLIEVVTGTSYEEFVRSNIFEPLGMDDSGYDFNSQIISNRAAGYSPGPDGPVNARFMHMSGPHAAGGLYSTSGDLLKWNLGLFGRELLSEGSLDRMVTPNLNDYAFGVIVMEDSDGRTVIQHGGGVPGFNTTLRYYPESEITVVALANINGNAPEEIAASLGAYVHGEEVVLTSERQEIEVDADVLADYVGIYQLSPQAQMTITLEAGQLVSQVSGQGKVPIFPESETRFFVRIVDAQIDFARDSTGAVSHLVLHQGGRDVTAPRTSNEVAVRTEIELAADVLAQYVGVYELAPGFDLTLRVDGGQVTAQATGQGAFPIFAETEDRFFARVVDIEIEFVRDAGGEVSGLVLQQGPVRTEAARK